MIRAVCYSHIGKRPVHEDNALLNGKYITSDMQMQMPREKCICSELESTKRVNLFALSDGMGGHKAGETASQICMERLSEIENELQSCSSVKEAVKILQGEIAQINRIVSEQGNRSEELRGMGATLVMLIIYDSECAIMNIGDSRAYQFDGESLIQLTKDHTEGQRMLDLGLLSRKELAGFPARKNLTRYVGYDQEGYILRADEYYPVWKSGIILLCSDGVTDVLTEERIRQILCTEEDLKDSAEKMVREAASAANADNTTVVLITMER